MVFSFVFIGSTHGYVDDFKKQKEIILSIKPEYVLCEDLENLILDSDNKFKDIIKKRTISNMTSYEEIEKLLKLCFEKNIKLIGIDMRNFGFDEKFQKKIKNQENLKPDEEKKMNQILKLREKLHINKVLEYSKITNKTIVVIIGNWHLKKESLLRKKLTNYKIIMPCDKNGEPLFEPKGEHNIKYLEIVNEDKN